MKQQTLPTPTAASLIGSFIWPAMAELMTRHKKPATFEVVAGIASLKNYLKMVPVLIFSLSSVGSNCC